jgi:hypothetical protein
MRGAEVVPLGPSLYQRGPRITLPVRANSGGRCTVAERIRSPEGYEAETGPENGSTRMR